MSNPEEVSTCTRSLPHICTVNGPCNGFPKTDVAPAAKRGPCPEETPSCPLCGSVEALREELAAAQKLSGELETVESNLADYAKRFFRLFDQYRNAWLREMGGVIVPKHWEIDGFVLRAEEIYEKAKLVDRMKQIMISEEKRGGTRTEMFDAVFKMLAEDGGDKVATN